MPVILQEADATLLLENSVKFVLSVAMITGATVASDGTTS